MRNDIGRVYSLLGEEQKALDYYNQALPQATAVNDPLLEAVIFYNLDVYKRQSQHNRPFRLILYWKRMHLE